MPGQHFSACGQAGHSYPKHGPSFSPAPHSPRLILPTLPTRRGAAPWDRSQEPQPKPQVCQSRLHDSDYGWPGGGGARCAH